MNWILSVIAVCLSLGIINWLHDPDGDRDSCHGSLSLTARRVRGYLLLIIIGVSVVVSNLVYFWGLALSDPQLQQEAYLQAVMGMFGLLVGAQCCLILTWIGDKVAETLTGEARVM